MNKNLIKRLPINNQIRAPKVRLINETDKQLGVVELREALGMALERNLDLIQVTEKVDPPVCKIGDYGKYLYAQEKREKTTKKHHGGELKGIRLGFNISPHDIETKVHLAEKFLKKGDKVLVELPLRGRERALQNFGKEKIEKFLEILNGVTPTKVERPLKREGRGFSIIISGLSGS